MAIRFSVVLHARPDQVERLGALQRVFVQACNSLTPLVRDTRCWNRVGLHQMAYRQLRERFPQLGSQMACNAIYSVSRASRIVYQNPGSPWLASRQPEQALPLIVFDGQAPVYFDRHTLSLRNGAVSMFTLDGRMRFEVNLSTAQTGHFLNDRLREVVLQQNDGVFQLTFSFTPADAAEAPESQDGHLPEYLVVNEASNPTPAPTKLTGVA
jgi:hypothetical protein